MLDTQFDVQIQNHIDQKTKPMGALGQLETIAAQLARIQSQASGSFSTTIDISSPQVIVFSADHGISEQGVSIAPSAVTQQMVLNFLAGGAAINCFCRANNIDFQVVDCGMVAAVESDSDQLILSRLGEGTKDFSAYPAMTATQLEQGLSAGSEIVSQAIKNGTNV